ncbi:MAG: hypothetical protein ACLRS8_00285 [Parabacteroides merdae]
MKELCHNLSSSFLAAKKVVFQAGPARRLCSGWLLVKIFLTLPRERIFSQASLAGDRRKTNWKKHKK